MASKIVDQVIPAAAVSQAEFVAANTSKVARSRVVEHVRRAAKTIADARDCRTPTPGFNEFGSCAASKLLGRSGHAPLEMTEMFFKPKDTEAWQGATFSVISNATSPVAPAWLKAVLNNDLSRRQPIPYGQGQSVASCHSCQAVLPLTMCPERVCSK